MENEYDEEAVDDLIKMFEQDDATGQDTAPTSDGVWSDLHEKERGLTSAWQSFCSFFEHLRQNNGLQLVPGHPTTPDDILKPEAPAIDHGTCAAFMLHYVSGAQGLIGDVISVHSAVIKWRAFKRFYFLKRGKRIAQAISGAIGRLLASFVHEGLLTDEQRMPPFVTAEGLKQICFALWGVSEDTTVNNLSWCPPSDDMRIRMGLWASIMLQGSVRCCALLPDSHTANSPDINLVTYAHFRLLVYRSNSVIHIALRFFPRHSKTLTGKDTSHILLSTREAWRCPVAYLLLLAEKDGALPAGFSPHDLAKFLDDRDVAELDFQQKDSPVFKGAVIDPMSDEYVRRVLGQLSDSLGLEQSITSHCFRRAGLVYMSINGISIEHVQLKADHVWGTTSTDVYIRQLPPIDVGATVFGTPSKLKLVAALHPKATNVTNPVPLPLTPPPSDVKPTSPPAYLTHMRASLHHFCLDMFVADSEAWAIWTVPIPNKGKIYGLSPDSHPKDGICVGCGKALDELELSNYGTQSGKVFRHIIKCLGRAKVKDHLAELFETYPRQPPAAILPVVGKRARSHVVKDDSGDWIDLARLRSCVKSQVTGVGFYTCDCGTTSRTVAMANDHLLACKKLWLTVDLPSAHARFMEGNLEEAAAYFPSARYSYRQGTWLHDPIDDRIDRREEAQERFDNPPPGLIFGPRLDVIYHEDPYMAGLALRPLDSQRKRNPSDTRYRLQIANGTTVREGICFFCVNSDYVAPSEIQHSPTRNHKVYHFGVELQRVLKPSAKSLPSCLVDEEGRFACPDKACRNVHMKFDKLLALVWHLAAIHHVQIQHLDCAWKNLDNRQAIPLHQATFVNDEELFTFVDNFRPDSMFTDAENKVRRKGIGFTEEEPHFLDWDEDTPMEGIGEVDWTGDAGLDDVEGHLYWE